MKKYTPKLDPGFRPIGVELDDYVSRAKKAGKHEITICVERNDGYNYIYKVPAFKDNTGHDEETILLLERVVKTLLWLSGGYKVIINGSKVLAEELAKQYSYGGKRDFDTHFMERVYEQKFEVRYERCKRKLVEHKEVIEVQGDLSGHRIGFDAGGSDRKVSAVIDGKTVFATETVWNPKTNSNPQYHYDGIVDSFNQAKKHLNGRVDAVGISSAGIYINKKAMVASLFIQVGEEDFKKHVKDIYIRAVKDTFGDIPFTVANDGDVAALAGARGLKDNGVLGIAMGTSEAVGYVDLNGNLRGYLSELAFVPVDLNPKAMVDEWSGDYGCGVKYFSQDGVIKLAEDNGFKFEKGLTPAQKLKVIQKLNDEGDEFAAQIFTDIGIYLAYTLAYYAKFYEIKHVLLMGRVVSGKGGEQITNTCNKVFKEEYPHLAHITVALPDEATRRVGQSETAASMPSTK